MDKLWKTPESRKYSGVSRHPFLFNLSFPGSENADLKLCYQTFGWVADDFKISCWLPKFSVDILCETGNGTLVFRKQNFFGFSFPVFLELLPFCAWLIHRVWNRNASFFYTCFTIHMVVESRCNALNHDTFAVYNSKLSVNNSIKFALPNFILIQYPPIHTYNSNRFIWL